MASNSKGRRRSARISKKNGENDDLNENEEIDIFKDVDWNDLMNEATEPITELRRDFDNLNVKGKDGLNEFIKNRMPMAYPVLIGLRREDKIDGMLLAIKANNIAAEAFMRNNNNVENEIEIDGNEGEVKVGSNINDSKEGSVDERKRKGRSKARGRGQRQLPHHTTDEESDSDVELGKKKKGNKKGKSKGNKSSGRGSPTKRKGNKDKRELDSTSTYQPSDTGDDGDVEEYDLEMMEGGKKSGKRSKKKKRGGVIDDDFDEMAQLSARNDRDMNNKNKEDGKSKKNKGKEKKKKKKVNRRGDDEKTIDDIDSGIVKRFEKDLRNLGIGERKKNKVM